MKKINSHKQILENKDNIINTLRKVKKSAEKNYLEMEKIMGLDEKFVQTIKKKSK